LVANFHPIGLYVVVVALRLFDRGLRTVARIMLTRQARLLLSSHQYAGIDAVLFPRHHPIDPLHMRKPYVQLQSGDRYFKDNAVYAKVKRVMQLYESKYKNDNALVYRKPVPAEPVQVRC
jgi:hypothetical protein